MNRPTPFFVAVLVGLILGWFCISVIVAIGKHRIERDAARAEQTCVSESGHKRVECP